MGFYPRRSRQSARLRRNRSIWSEETRSRVELQPRCGAGATLTGIYPGQPGRQTAQPTTEMMLSAFRGVTLSRIKIDGKLHEHLTPLHAVQKRILTLMEIPRESYDELVT